MTSGIAVAALGGLAAGLGAGWWLCRRRERRMARFLSFIAHEINSPITALNMTVLNFVQGTFGPLADKPKPWMEMIAGEAHRLTALVGDFRDLLHAELHRDLNLEKEDVCLGALARESAEAMKGALRRSEITLTADIPGDLPRIQGDPDRLRRVFSAILTHARKFRMQGDIILKAGPRGDCVAVSVAYTGMKATPAEVRSALDIYNPVRNPKTQVLAGVGLGLGLARVLIEAHGGAMTLEVDPGGETLIVVHIPKETS